MHPSSLRRRCPPPATSGPAAAAWPSYAIEVSRLASLWPRRGLPRRENEPAPDSELMPFLTRRMPPAAARTALLNPPQITPISKQQSQMGGGSAGIVIIIWNYATIHMNCISGDILLRRPGICRCSAKAGYATTSCAWRHWLRRMERIRPGRGVDI